ncbi:membrane protein [Chlamydia pecorum]|uniref:Uncharacterized protein n=2 Tax=Chlamydia pecorum TaxID=85991 RepID=A0AA34RCN2_CHLPE|nr:membrane protein [Chlamydia pecorum]AEB41236.1 conserved hypothetical protein [Chlamydia pecorum E58]AGW38371.1 hypothetical protein CPE1_0903 [Chlamydia pecorum PV3056/3]ETF39098.1 hypothetical protein CpecF_0198 [Chlamydia pecorum DBDeUG]ETF39774.1 hypothetical protein CpecG_0198 [Chlamydia pecorum MC/MarsBar]ETF40824.1 hypothetical protein CpecA_0199 [Chlamydia pecorum IPTaLE]
MASQSRHKRSFFLVEILMAISLTCVVLLPCIQFYSGVRKSFEENILLLQLPATIDSCFFAIEEDMRMQMLAGEFPSSGSGTLSSPMYTSLGKEILVPYAYKADIRKGVRMDNNIVKVCLADVSVELFPNQKHMVFVQRSLCVTS